MRGRTLLFVTAITTAVMAVSIYGILDGRTPAKRSTPKAMVRVPGGTFLMGQMDTNPDERPVHKVTLRPFFIDRHEVTNQQFAAFVEATGYVTRAEKDGYSWCYLEDADNFEAVTGADWRHPQGPGSTIEDRMDHPVVCVSWEDASAYARWAGKRLLTEAEWEYAARAGSAQHFRAIENRAQAAGAPSLAQPADDHDHAINTQDKSPSAKSHASAATHSSGTESGNLTYIQANIWQGTWPSDNKLLDGFYYTAPVSQFAPNDWGVYDMVGNVWEWTADWYGSDYYQHSPVANPSGPDSGEYRVARGGSWFCSPNYCGAYSTYFRGASPPAHTFNNVGFRCAADVSPAGDQQ